MNIVKGSNFKDDEIVFLSNQTVNHLHVIKFEIKVINLI